MSKTFLLHSLYPLELSWNVGNISIVCQMDTDKWTTKKKLCAIICCVYANGLNLSLHSHLSNTV